MKSRFRVSESYAAPYNTFDPLWTGSAWDADDALERALGDESPGSLVTYRVERWGTVKISRSMTQPGWVKVWQGQISLY